jgi:hypothetical protein
MACLSSWGMKTLNISDAKKSASSVGVNVAPVSLIFFSNEVI